MKIYEIEQIAFDNNGYSIYFITQAMEFLSNSIFVAEENDTIIGFCIGALDQKDKTKGWFLNLAIGKNYQNRGIGYKLMEKLLTFFKNSGCNEVNLTVDPKNSAGIHLYEKLGFEKGKIMKDYFGANKDHLLMIKYFEE